LKFGIILFYRYLPHLYISRWQYSIDVVFWLWYLYYIVALSQYPQVPTYEFPEILFSSCAAEGPITYNTSFVDLVRYIKHGFPRGFHYMFQGIEHFTDVPPRKNYFNMLALSLTKRTIKDYEINSCVYIIYILHTILLYSVFGQILEYVLTPRALRISVWRW